MFVELKSTISLLNINTKNEMSVSVINTIQHDFKRYPKFNKNKLHNRSIGAKTSLQVQHDFWKETPEPKRMLLVGFHLHSETFQTQCMGTGLTGLTYIVNVP